MPIPADEFESLDDEKSRIDLSPDTTQGTVYHFLLDNADRAFRQREIASVLDIPPGSVGPTLSRLEERGLLEHRGPYWRIDETQHALASAASHGLAAADDRDGGFTAEEVASWMASAVDPIEDSSTAGSDADDG